MVPGEMPPRMIMRKAKRWPKETTAQRQMRPAEVLSSTVCWRMQRARRKERRGTRRGGTSKVTLCSAVLSRTDQSGSLRDRAPRPTTGASVRAPVIPRPSSSPRHPSVYAQASLGLCVLVCSCLSCVLCSTRRSTAHTPRAHPALARCYPCPHSLGNWQEL